MCRHENRDHITPLRYRLHTLGVRNAIEKNEVPEVYPDPNLIVTAVATILLVMLAVGTFHLLRKHGSFMGALVGGEAVALGEVIAGTIKNGDSEFRISQVVRDDKPHLILFRIVKTDCEGSSVSIFTMDREKAIQLSVLLAEAADSGSSARLN